MIFPTPVRDSMSKDRGSARWVEMAKSRRWPLWEKNNGKGGRIPQKAYGNALLVCRRAAPGDACPSRGSTTTLPSSPAPRFQRQSAPIGRRRLTTTVADNLAVAFALERQLQRVRQQTPALRSPWGTPRARGRVSAGCLRRPSEHVSLPRPQDRTLLRPLPGMRAAPLSEASYPAESARARYEPPTRRRWSARRPAAM